MSQNCYLCDRVFNLQNIKKQTFHHSNTEKGENVCFVN